MKKLLCMILTLALAASFAGAALAEEEPSAPPAAQTEPAGPAAAEAESDPSALTRYGAAKGATVSVTGSATILVPADTATVRLGVTESAQNVLEAQSAMNAKIEAIRQALLESGIEEKSINTDRLNIYTNYSYADDGTERVSGYTASSTLSIVTHDMESTGAIIDTAFTAGANTLNGIEFSVENTETIMDQAYVQAMLDAHDKAELLAQTEGASVRGVVSIEQGGSYSYDSLSNATRMETSADMGSSTFVQAALIEVSASVSVTYELQ